MSFQKLNSSTQVSDTPRTDAFYPNHDAAIASPDHAANRSSGLKALAVGLWKTAWANHPKISDEFFIAHESLEVASEQMKKLEAEVERLKLIIQWSADLMAETGRERTAQNIRLEVIDPIHFK